VINDYFLFQKRLTPLRGGPYTYRCTGTAGATHDLTNLARPLNPSARTARQSKVEPTSEGEIPRTVGFESLN
jgi:hypothetical protein